MTNSSLGLKKKKTVLDSHAPLHLSKWPCIYVFFFSGSFFLTHKNTYHWIFLAYLRIISNQIAIQTTNVWYSYLLAKIIGKLQCVYVVWDLKLALQMLSIKPTFCLAKQTQMSKNAPSWKNKNKGHLHASVFFFFFFFFFSKKVPENLTHFFLLYCCVCQTCLLSHSQC